MSFISTRSCNVRKGAFDSVMSDQGKYFSMLLDLYIVIRKSCLYELYRKTFFTLLSLLEGCRRMKERLSPGMVHPFKGESSGGVLFCIDILKCLLTVMFY